jgi:hypothetical protein
VETRLDGQSPASPDPLLLAGWLDGRLDARLTSLVEATLAADPHLLRDLRSLRTVLDHPAAPLAEAVLDRLCTIAHLRRRWRLPARILAAAALVMISLGGLLLGRQARAATRGPTPPDGRVETTAAGPATFFAEATADLFPEFDAP